MREAGLPILEPNMRGEQLLTGAKGVVRALYPDLWRVDLETEDGSLLTYVPVIGPYFPELHADASQPSHVGYLHVKDSAMAFCWPMPHRRLLGPHDSPPGAAGASQPERRYYHLHNYIFRSGEVTVRITKDNRLVFEGEQGDYIQFDVATREVRIHAPSVFVGTEDGSRIEYERDDLIRAFAPWVLLGTETGDRLEYHQGTHVHVASPEVVIGATAVPDADGLTYLQGVLLHLVSTLIRLTADQVVIESSNTRFGSAAASERLMLGDSWMALYNTFITLFNTHTHGNVQNGGGVTNAPVTGAAPMTTAQLSSVARVSP
jgi:hypothetical protein